MKRLTLLVAGSLLLFFAWAFAAEKPAAPPPAPAKIRPAVDTKMRAPGKIIEITDAKLTIERKVKDSIEIMEFILEKPMKFKIGDNVRITYVEDKGKKLVTRIVKLSEPEEKGQAGSGKEVKPATKSVVPAGPASAPR